MSTFHNGNAGILSAATTFGATTTGILFIPGLTDSLFFKIVAYTSYCLLSLLLLSFIARQLIVSHKLKTRR